jgi:virginiamycin A acetyltransferase
MGLKYLIRKYLIHVIAKKKGFTIYNYNVPLKILPYIGTGVLINRDVYFESDKNIEIGNYTYINGGHIYCAKIGKYCSIGHGVSIGPDNHHLNRVSTFPISSRALNKHNNCEFATPIPTIIKNDVWIGNNAIIMQGISVGNGAVIASGAVVTKDVPPYAIVGGVPASVIRYRFDYRIIKQIEASNWWNKDINWIAQNIANFQKEIKTQADISFLL